MTLPSAYANPAAGGTSFPLNSSSVPLIGVGDGAHLSALNGLRIAEPRVIFESMSRYSDETDSAWYHKLAVSGTTTHLPNEAAVRMDVAVTDASRVVRQSRHYFSVPSGKSILAKMAFAMGTPQANTVKRAGLFDDENGVFFEADNTDLSIVLRSFVTGSVVNTSIAQASWNIDRLDGTGDSGLTLDAEKAQELVVDMSSSSIGRIRVGFAIAGKIIYCHQFLTANSGTTSTLTTPRLPVRYEIVNTDTAAATNSMKALSASVISEGGQQEVSSTPFSATLGAAPRTVSSTLLPLLAIRPAATFESQTWRLPILVDGFSLINTDANDILWVIYWFDGTTSNAVTGGTWTAEENLGGVAVNSTGTSITFDGSNKHYEIAAGYLGGQQTLSIADIIKSQGLLGNYPLTLDIDGNNPSELVLAAIRTAATDSAVAASINYRIVL